MVALGVVVVVGGGAAAVADDVVDASGVVVVVVVVVLEAVAVALDLVALPLLQTRQPHKWCSAARYHCC